jgi:GNAT superfamily N-acetyltransferase
VQRPTEQITGLRHVTDADAAGLIALVAAAYAEHPGCVLDLPGVDDDLPTPGTVAADRGSPWWVVERHATIVATIGAGPLRDDGHVELKRLYVAAPDRGRGLASRLVGLVEAHAAGTGARAVDLWSDSRFTAAHHRYRALGYVDTGETRYLDDPSETTEHRFLKVLAT